ncbi:MAG: helix-turn-helix transcriptional regulator [Clostridia bacterium]|nr:helix-turn-helix transcriptional regulator [Clostridia bacterium]
MTFAEKLRMLRKRKGYTQQELADIIGVTPRTLINYEMGKCCPKQTELYMKLASVFNVDMEDLITDTDLAAKENGKEENAESATKEMRKLIAKMNGLFAGGQLSEDDRDKVMYAITDMYWKAKTNK